MTWSEYYRLLSGKGGSKPFKEPDSIETFGRSLGVALKPWIKKYGAAWQFILANAVANERLTHYGGIAIPRTKDLYKQAKQFLYHNKLLFRPGLRTDQYLQSPTSLIHHTLLDKAYNDVFRFKVLYGSTKVVDQNAKQAIVDLKDLIKYTSNRSEKHDLKNRLRDLERSVKRYKWEVEAEKSKVYSSNYSTPDVKDIDSLVKGRWKERFNMQVSMINAKRELSIRAEYDGQNLGVAVGEGLRKHRRINTDPEAVERFIKFLKRARWLRGAVWRGAKRSKRIKQAIINDPQLGRRFYYEWFEAPDAFYKYATDANFIPGSEYGYKKNEYKEGEATPLVKRRVFRGTKEVIRNIDD